MKGKGETLHYITPTIMCFGEIRGCSEDYCWCDFLGGYDSVQICKVLEYL